jgi:hypothetical protein
MPLAHEKYGQKSMLSLPPSATPPQVLYVVSVRWQSASGNCLQASDEQQYEKKSVEHLLLKQPSPVGQSQAELHEVLPSDDASGVPLLPPVPPPEPVSPAVPPPVVVPAEPPVAEVDVALPPEPPLLLVVLVVELEPPEPALPLELLLLSSLEHPKSAGTRQIPITTTYRERIRSPLELPVVSRFSHLKTTDQATSRLAVALKVARTSGPLCVGAVAVTPAV